MPIELARIKVRQRDVMLFLTTYVKAHVPAIFATISDDGMQCPYGTLSVNLLNQGLELDPWCVSIKDWDGNEDLAQACLESGLFRPTPVRWRLPFGEAPVWSLAAERLPPDTVRQISSLMRWPVSGQHLVELTARCAQGAPVNLDIGGLSVAARYVEASDSVAMRALWFDGVASRELVDCEPKEVAEAIGSLRFDLTSQDGERFFNGMRKDLSLQARRALVEPALQALSVAAGPAQQSVEPASQAAEDVSALPVSPRQRAA